MLQLLDKAIMWVISWLYAKHTRIYLHLEAKKSEAAAPYEPPQPEVIDRALACFGCTRDDLAVRMGAAHHLGQSTALDINSAN